MTAQLNKVNVTLSNLKYIFKKWIKDSKVSLICNPIYAMFHLFHNNSVKRLRHYKKNLSG